MSESEFEIESSQQHSDLIELREEQSEEQAVNLIQSEREFYQEESDEGNEKEDLENLKQVPGYLKDDYFEVSSSENLQEVEQPLNQKSSFEQASIRQKIQFLRDNHQDVLKMIKEVTDTSKVIEEELIPLLELHETSEILFSKGREYLEGKLALFKSYLQLAVYYIYLVQKKEDFQSHDVLKLILKLKNIIEQPDQEVQMQFQDEMEKFLKREIQSSSNQQAFDSQKETISQYEGISQQEAINQDGAIYESASHFEISEEAVNKATALESVASDEERIFNQNKQETSLQGDNSALMYHDSEDFEELDKVGLNSTKLSKAQSGESDISEFIGQVQKQKQKVKKIVKEKLTKKAENEKAEFKKQHTLHEVHEDAPRTITYNILKSQGLKRRRPKENRNSRVVLRHKFKKAQQKVRSMGIVYNQKQITNYDGEMAIKEGNIKSTKIK